MDNAQFARYSAEFEGSGETFVRIKLSEWSKHEPMKHVAAVEWLRLKDEACSFVAASKRDAREEETLSIAKEANEIARSQSAAAWRAARYAMYAAAIATIAALVASKDAILALIFTP